MTADSFDEAISGAAKALPALVVSSACASAAAFWALIRDEWPIVVLSIALLVLSVAVFYVGLAIIALLQYIVESEKERS